MMLIDDEELRAVFRVASEEHLQNLDDGLLYLEKHPQDQATLEALMREAHSLKGDANMLGVTDVGVLAHQVEHVLSQLKRQEEVLSPELSDRLSHTLAAIRKLVNEVVTGQSAQVETFQILAELMGAEASDSAAVDRQVENAEPEGREPKSVEDQPNSACMAIQEPIDLADNPLLVQPVQSASPIVSSLPTPQSAPPATAAGSSSDYRIETIRVGTRSLDTLMTQAGELTVTKIRIAHRLAEVEAISNLWEEWSRDRLLHRSGLDEGPSGHATFQRLKTAHQGTGSRLEQLGELIKGLRSSLAEDTTRLEQLSSDMEAGIRTLRLLPLSTLFNLFPRMVRDLARQEGKSIQLVLEGGETRADKRLLEEMKDPLMHMLRNAIDHGIESPAERQRLGKPAIATIYLRAYQTPTNIVLEVCDDGRGLDIDKIKQTALQRGICREDELANLSSQQIQALIFSPGFSTAPFVTEVSGRGVGLDVVHTNVEKLKGKLEVESAPGQGCTLRIHLGITLATAHVLLVLVNRMSYAIPVEFVRTACLVKPEEVFRLEGHDTIVREAQPVSVAHLADLLELAPAAYPLASQVQKSLTCIIVQIEQEQLGIFVDALVDEQDVVLKPQSQLLKRVRNVSGATILGTGEVCMVLNPQDLIKSARCRSHEIGPPASQQPESPKPTILLVEDAIATRTQERRILEAAGYQVITAVDGLDGYNKLQAHIVDAVVTDVQMPNLSGLELTAKIRQHPEYNELPIVLVTSLASDEDKRRGAEAGANAYITKASFNQDALLATLKRLV